MTELHTMMLLELIRQTNVTLPLNDDWSALSDQFDILQIDGLITPDGTITSEGKKLLLMFDAERRDILKGSEVYESVLINGQRIDARLPVLDYKYRKSADRVDMLFNMACIMYWDAFFQQFKATVSSGWQANFLDSYTQYCRRIADSTTWRMLGASVREAVLNCERLLNPIETTQIIKR